MTDDMTVSVIMPVYNGAKTLRDAIESVIAQSYRPIELIIVNDGSTDASEEILAEYLSQYSKDATEASDSVLYDEIRASGITISLITQPNSGAASARNRGIREATGRYISFIDADDIWNPDKLTTQIEFMRKTGSIFCYSACDIMDESGRPTGRTRSVPKKVDFKDLLYDNVIPCLTVVLDYKGLNSAQNDSLESDSLEIEPMRGMSHEQINGYDWGFLGFPAIRHEDYALWLAILKGDYTGGVSVTAAGITTPLAKYRVAAGSLSGNKVRAAGWHYNVYRNYLGLGILRSLWYFVGYALRSLVKRL